MSDKEGGWGVVRYMPRYGETEEGDGVVSVLDGWQGKEAAKAVGEMWVKEHPGHHVILVQFAEALHKA